MGRILLLKTLILLFVLLTYNDGFVILQPKTTKKTTSSITKSTLTFKELTTTMHGEDNIFFFPCSKPQCVLSSLSLSNTNSDLDSWELLENDFSSSYLWDQYYHDNPIESSTLEWHKSISFDIIGQYCLSSSSSFMTTNDENDDNQDNNVNSIDNIHQCLMIGCGTSFLPEHVIDLSHTSSSSSSSSNSNKNLHVTLLDSSISCMETVRRRYENYPQYTNHLSYVVGNVLELEAIFSSSTTSSPSTTTTTIIINNDNDNTNNHNNNNNDIKIEFDVILDKGLMDALLCNDNWETTVTTLLQQSFSIMKKHNKNTIGSSSSRNSTGSRYVLIGYKLSTTTQETLVRIGQAIGLQWEFNCTGSNDRVWISVARVVSQ